MLDDKMMMEVLPILRREFDAALAKHPEFPGYPEEAVSIILEELGELAKELNDRKEGWNERALNEAAHVAVTAIRTMTMFTEEYHTEKYPSGSWKTVKNTQVSDAAPKMRDILRRILDKIEDFRYPGSGCFEIEVSDSREFEPLLKEAREILDVIDASDAGKK